MMMNNAMKKIKTRQTIVAIVCVVIIVLIALNSLLFYTRIDLTKNKAYSISKISRDIVRAASDTIYIDYYLSPKLKTATPSPQQMIDVLQEYQSRSNGNVVFAEKDASQPQYAGVLQENGLQPQQIQVVEKNQSTYAVVYSGIIITYQDKKRILPFFLQPAILEYQITSKIQEILTDDTRVAGILPLDSLYTQQQALQGLQQTLQSDYDVQMLEPGKKISDDVDVVFVIGAQDADNDTVYYLDQFLMQGKGVYFAIDSARIDVTAGLTGTNQDTLLHRMLQYYGIIVEDTIVLDKYNKLIPMSRGNGLQTLQQYPMWVTIIPQNVNPDNPITAQFGGLDLYWASPLTIAKDKQQYFTTLAFTSQEAWTKGYTEQQDPQTPDDENAKVKVYQITPDVTGFLADKTTDNTKQYSVTTSFLGPLTSFVETGAITIPAEEKDSYISHGDSARFITTGSALFASWMYQFTNAQYNLVFLSNASDWLGSDEKLLQIKSRVVKDVRLNKIADPVKKAAWAFVVQLWNIVVIPLLIIVIAIVVLLFRKRVSQKKQYHHHS